MKGICDRAGGSRARQGTTSESMGTCALPRVHTHLPHALAPITTQILTSKTLHSGCPVSDPSYEARSVAGCEWLSPAVWLRTRGGFRAPPPLLPDCSDARARPLTAGSNCPRCLTNGTSLLLGPATPLVLLGPTHGGTHLVSCAPRGPAGGPAPPSLQPGRPTCVVL